MNNTEDMPLENQLQNWIHLLVDTAMAASKRGIKTDWMEVLNDYVHFLSISQPVFGKSRKRIKSPANVPPP